MLKDKLKEILPPEIVRDSNGIYCDLNKQRRTQLLAAFREYVEEVIGEDLDDSDIIASGGSITITQANLVNMIRAEQRKRAQSLLSGLSEK